MKELTIEQKAKAYDEVIERGNSLLNCNELGNAWVYKLLPELKKPEDEEIRKTIIRLIEHNIKDGFSSYDSIEYSDMIDWLRKQEQLKKIPVWKHWKNGIAGNGEGKPIFLIKDGSTYSLTSCLSFECDYIELSELDNLIIKKQPQTYLVPKFRVSDWITNGASTWRIDSIEDDMYYTNHCGIDCGGDIKSIDEQYHIWTIQDAKDGDILVTEKGEPFIFKGCLDKIHPNSPVAYCGICTDGGFCISNSYHINRWTDKNAYPATKEQRELLFQKMKEKGYKWDADKKKIINL